MRTGNLAGGGGLALVSVRSPLTAMLTAVCSILRTGGMHDASVHTSISMRRVWDGSVCPPPPCSGTWGGGGGLSLLPVVVFHAAGRRSPLLKGYVTTFRAILDMPTVNHSQTWNLI